MHQCLYWRNTDSQKITVCIYIVWHKKWDIICPHALRAIYITKLANDPSVNIEETMTAACHSPVAASAIYQQRSLVSKANTINALLPISKPTQSKVSQIKQPQKLDEQIQFSPVNFKTTSDNLPKANFYTQEVTPSVITTTSSKMKRKTHPFLWQVIPLILLYTPNTIVKNFRFDAKTMEERNNTQV